jgi:hypothetical protein
MSIALLVTAGAAVAQQPSADECSLICIAATQGELSDEGRKRFQYCSRSGACSKPPVTLRFDNPETILRDILKNPADLATMSKTFKDGIKTELPRF